MSEDGQGLIGREAVSIVCKMLDDTYRLARSTNLDKNYSHEERQSIITGLSIRARILDEVYEKLWMARMKELEAENES